MKRVAIVYDVPFWAQYNIAAALKKYADPERFHVTIHRHNNWPSKNEEYLKKLDGVLFLGWYEQKPTKHTRSVAMLSHHGAFYEYQMVFYGGGHWQSLGASRQRNVHALKDKIRHFDGILCTSQKLHTQLVNVMGADMDGLSTVWYPICVDHEIWQPPQEDKGYPVDDKPVIGWCGQATPGLPCVKGFDWCLVPLIQSLPEVTFRLNARNHTNALHEKQMLLWYQSLDLFINTSIEEGTPTPALEAMACGVPVVMPDVGDVGDFILNNRSRDNLFGSVVDPYYNHATVKDTIEQMRTDILLYTGGSLAVGSNPSEAVRRHRNWEVYANEWLKYVAGGG